MVMNFGMSSVSRKCVDSSHSTRQHELKNVFKKLLRPVVWKSSYQVTSKFCPWRTPQRTMFKFFTQLAHTASELLAPSLKPEEELFLQWHNFVKELKRRSGTNISVEETDVPLRLQWVFNIIQQELASIPAPGIDHSKAKEPVWDTGPCMEIALRYKIFDWLVALAKTDRPSGIKSYILFFVTSVLRSPNVPAFLPKSFIYKPLARLVGCCGSNSCSPWDREELHFLQSVVDVVTKDPCLANLFLKSSLPDPSDRLDMDLKALVLPQNPFSAGQQTAESQGQEVSGGASHGSITKETFTFPLLDSLLRLALNPDPTVSSQSRQAVVTIMLIREPIVCESIAHSGTFLPLLMKHLHRLYLTIPETTDAKDVLIHSTSGDIEHVVRSYVQWVTFLDQISASASDIVLEELRRVLEEHMTNGGFADDWLSGIQEKNEKALAVFLKTYRTAESRVLLSILSAVFLEPRIFQMCLHYLANSDSSLLAFDVLDTIIQKPSFELMDVILLRYLDTRLYIRKEQRMHDSRKDVGIAEAGDRAAMFRDLFPSTAKSCTSTEEEKDCESYNRESYYSMVRIMQRCQDLQWPSCGLLKPCNILLAEESAFFDGQAFNEGPLLRILFARLTNLFNQPYTLNLRVTGVLSKICLIPHPALREYLLDPTVPLSSQCASLYRCLVNLVQKMDEYAKQTPNFQDKLIKVRQEIRNGQWAEVAKNPESMMLSGVITLEEFCKEIAARAFVRYNNPVIL